MTSENRYGIGSTASCSICPLPIAIQPNRALLRVRAP
jgi:hypothetical protein